MLNTFLKKKNFFGRNIEDNVFIVAILLIGIIFSFCAIKISKYSLYNRFKDKIISLEGYLNQELNNSKQILFSLSITIAENSKNETYNISDMIENFDYKNNFNLEGDGLLGKIIYVDDNAKKNGKSNFISQIKNKSDVRRDIYNCFGYSTGKPFQVNIRPITYNEDLMGNIMPIDIAIFDTKGIFLGRLCSTIPVTKLEKKLGIFFDARYFENVKLVNKTNISEKVGEKTISDSVKMYVDAYFFSNGDQLLYSPDKYPFDLKIILRHKSLKKIAFTLIFSIMSITATLIFFFYGKARKMEAYYETPLKLILEKMEFNKMLIQKNENYEKLNIERVTKREFCLNNFVKLCEEQNELIANYLKEKDLKQLEQNELFSKVSSLIFLDHHFSRIKKVKLNEEDIFHHKMYKFLNEDFTNIKLRAFMNSFQEYCSEFFYEISVSVIWNSIDEDNFVNVKQTAFTECLTSIVNLIVRSGKYEDQLYIDITHDEQEDFPIIEIVALFMGEQGLRNLGWENGPDFVDTGLLTIHLLAKENNLLFNIRDQGNKIYFSLKSVNNKVKFYKNHVFDISNNLVNVISSSTI